MCATTLMKHIPRVEPQAREDQHRRGHPIKNQAREQLREPAGAAIWRDGANKRGTRSRVPILAPLQQGQFPAGGTLVLRRLATPHLVRLLGEWRGGGTTYLELAGALRALTVEGRLPPHTGLPSERALAAALGVSRNTATAALGVLREQGFLASRPGTGSWVTHPPARHDRPDESRSPAGDVIDLTLANLPAPPELAALASAAAAALPRELGGHGYEPFGLPAARAAVATHLSDRGLPTSPDQVLITQGRCTRSISRCARSRVPATACWWSRRRIPPRSTRSGPTAASRSASRSARPAGTSRCCARRCTTHGRGSAI